MGALTYKGVLSCRGDPGLSLIIAARRGTVEGETVVRWGGQASSVQGTSSCATASTLVKMQLCCIHANR